MDALQFENNTCKSVAYEDLSNEFQSLYPTVVRAYQLIGMMYNRLTLIDGFGHREAFKKIYEDHKHLSGFSSRNLRRYLPQDNPNVPHRVRTSRPNSSGTEIIRHPESNNNKNQSKIEAQAIELHNDNNITRENAGNERIKELEEELKQLNQELENKRAENAGLSTNVGSLERKVAVLDKKNENDVFSSTQEDIINFELAFEWIPVFDYMNELYKKGLTSKVWFSGAINRKTGKVIASYVGRRLKPAEKHSNDR